MNTWRDFYELLNISIYRNPEKRWTTFLNLPLDSKNYKKMTQFYTNIEDNFPALPPDYFHERVKCSPSII